MSFVRESVTVGQRHISIETGKWAKQASGSVVVRCGDSMVLVTATAAKSPRVGMDFLPLTCEYQEKTYAAGKIPGSFFRREGRPSTDEVLTSRLMDRPTRPMFPKAWRCETQIIANVVSFDQSNAADVLAMTGASA
ncbi:MAG TPA: polyribonucleotide nucleotidyltransferase, partial [Haliangium sp.]|nr:polyribonucleotide nucleotidyltransferase [Haliangium sp.]